MPKQIALSLFASLIVFSNYSFAGTQMDVVETCAITASRSFDKATQIFCDADLKIAPGIVLDAGANTLQIYSVGRVEFGAGSKLLSSSRDSNVVSVFARTAAGQLDLSTASDVEMEFASLSAEYQQSIKTQYGAEVRMLVSGQLLLLDGPENKIIR